MMTVEEVKKILENVPDEYRCIISLEMQALEHVTVDDEERTVDFQY